tara:strand:- start:5656 stop:7866 length:2211 start_codon:yes stop_codon:yes gene_type:complete
MAIIYSYPEIGTLAAGDLMPISDISDNNATKSVTLTKLATYFQGQQAANVLDISSNNGTTGSIDLASQVLNFTGGLLINTAIDPDLGQNVTINHNTVGRTNTGGQTDLQFGQEFDVINSVTTDSSGHISGVNVETFLMPAEPSGTVSGTGTTNNIVKWTAGGQGVIGDSQIIENSNGITIDPSSKNVGINKAANSNFGLDVEGVVSFRKGLIISNNPANPVVNETSAIIGAGSNDIISGSDHCLTVGENNQITDNSDRSVSFGVGNTTKSSVNAAVVGSGNVLKYSTNSHIIGLNNVMGYDIGANTAGLNNSIIIGSDNLLTTQDGSAAPPSGGLSFVIGHDNDLKHTETNSFTFGYNVANLGGQTISHRNDFNIGGDLSATNECMTLGYRNDASEYPSQNNPAGLGKTKFVVATGSNNSDDANALMITEGGVFVNAVKQVPRVSLPTVPTFAFNNDDTALTSGIPYGGLYNSGGFVKIQRSNNIALSVTTVGSGYNEGDTYSTTATTGSGFGLTILVDEILSGSGIDTFSVVNPGEGYAVGDTVAVAGGAILTVTIGNTVSSNSLYTGDIYFNKNFPTNPNWSIIETAANDLEIKTTGGIALNVTTAGTGYNEDDIYNTSTSGSGSGLRIKVLEIDSNSGVTAFSVASGGEGYVVGDTVTLTGGGSGGNSVLTVTVGSASDLIVDTGSGDPCNLLIKRGDVSVLNSNKGLVLTAPNGDNYRIKVDNSGNLTTTLA